MADAQLQATVHLAAAAAAINKPCSKRCKKYTLPDRYQLTVGKSFFINQDSDDEKQRFLKNCYHNAAIFSAALIPSRAEETIPPE